MCIQLSVQRTQKKTGWGSFLSCNYIVPRKPKGWCDKNNEVIQKASRRKTLVAQGTSDEPRREKTGFAYSKIKAQISFAVPAKIISAFVFTTRIVLFLYFLNSKFPVSSDLLCLYSSVCVRPCRKPR